eukprot:TRINITY_DN66400_c0_g1_i1.p1 TRINITY_DN66400_c0_g1~~TRINITY_DN66400_c0_g1_i1.p1  ORF type:complete len:193 (+),score=18.04 TRINITY_DN66400_c0_g1_i1:73-651(+)
MASDVADRIFQKTKMCRFFNIGVCKNGSSCYFAHSKEELRRRVDLTCTKLCPIVVRNGMCCDVACKYAHAREQLRKIGHGSSYKKNEKHSSREKPRRSKTSYDAQPTALGDGIQAVKWPQPPVRWPQPPSTSYKPSASSNISTASTDDTDVSTFQWTRLCMTTAGSDDSLEDRQGSPYPCPIPTIAYVAQVK